MTISLQQGIVYGPVASRRLGRSLGVNVLPGEAKTCNFNCAYCQYGWTRPARGEVEWPAPSEIERALAAALERDSRVDRITLAGNGEPTLHPAFAEIVERLRGVRGALAPRARLAVLSNSSTAGQPGIAAALVRLDECYMKVDAGDDDTLKRMNGPGFCIDEIVEALSHVGGVVAQSIFTRDARGRIDNTTDDVLSAWIAAIRRIGPMAVHVYSIDRGPAWPELQPVPRRTLDAIARRVELAGIPAVVF